MIGHWRYVKELKPCCYGKAADQSVIIQVAEMLRGAAGKLVGIGSGLPSASALARRYIWLLVAPWDSIAAATTAQLRISVVIFRWMKTH